MKKIAIAGIVSLMFTNGVLHGGDQQILIELLLLSAIGAIVLHFLKSVINDTFLLVLFFVWFFMISIRVVL